MHTPTNLRPGLTPRRVPALHAALRVAYATLEAAVEAWGGPSSQRRDPALERRVDEAVAAFNELAGFGASEGIDPEDDVLWRVGDADDVIARFAFGPVRYVGPLEQREVEALIQRARCALEQGGVAENGFYVRVLQTHLGVAVEAIYAGSVGEAAAAAMSARRTTALGDDGGVVLLKADRAEPIGD